jgi:hypothetical protein
MLVSGFWKFGSVDSGRNISAESGWRNPYSRVSLNRLPPEFRSVTPTVANTGYWMLVRRFLIKALGKRTASLLTLSEFGSSNSLVTVGSQQGHGMYQGTGKGGGSLLNP